MIVFPGLHSHNRFPEGLQVRQSPRHGRGNGGHAFLTGYAAPAARFREPPRGRFDGVYARKMGGHTDGARDVCAHPDAGAAECEQRRLTPAGAAGRVGPHMRVRCHAADGGVGLERKEGDGDRRFDEWDGAGVSEQPHEG